MSVTLEDLGAFLREPTPRVVPQNIRRQALRGFCGLGPTLVGAAVLAFGSLFLWIFFPWRFADEMRLDLGAPAKIAGRLTSAKDANMKINEVSVYRLSFQFQPPGQGPIQGTCYRTGAVPEAQQDVKVEYLADNPRVARIEGCRLNGFGYWTALVVVLPGTGMGLVYFSWRARRRRLQLLQNGTLVMGTVVDVKETSVTVNDQRRYRVSVAFNQNGESQLTSYHAYGADVESARNYQASQERLGLLCDPQDVRRVMRADTLLST